MPSDGSSPSPSINGRKLRVHQHNLTADSHPQQQQPNSQQHQQQSQQSRWTPSYHHHGGATPALVATLVFCSATFILFQVLVARATTVHQRRHRSLLALPGGLGGLSVGPVEVGGGEGEEAEGSSAAMSTRLRQLLGEPEAVGGSPQGIPGGTARPERILECLRALDAELRTLVYQPIPSVEKFTGDFLAAMSKLHDRGGGLGHLEHRLRQRQRLPDCRAASEPTAKELIKFYRNNSISEAWRPAWAADPLPGGRYCPGSCQSGKSVLILVPYRQRAEHLGSLLAFLHPILQGQNLCYTIVVGEQFGNATFNKAKLMNAAFMESMKLRHFDCVIFHDVDLLPTNPFVPYRCPVYPRHISVSVDKFGYSLPYKQLVGGVLAMPVRYFLKVNGYSNLFWGWGGEDDDMETRIRSAGLLVTRPHPKLARYRMIRHDSRKEILGEVRYKLLYLSSKRYRLDGLNSLNYSLVAMEMRPLYTHFLIDLGDPPKSSSFY